MYFLKRIRLFPFFPQNGPHGAEFQTFSAVGAVFHVDVRIVVFLGKTTPRAFRHADMAGNTVFVNIINVSFFVQKTVPPYVLLSS